MVFCPECESDLDIDEEEVEEGEVVSCAALVQPKLAQRAG